MQGWPWHDPTKPRCESRLFGEGVYPVHETVEVVPPAKMARRLPFLRGRVIR
jgi:hypothetical protein